MSRSSKADFLAETARRSDCPCWCVTDHDSARGEDDWVHEGAPLHIEDGVLARLCLSVDPERGTVDGPYVVVGSRELTVAEAEALGVSFIGLAVVGAASTRRGADETRSPGP
jgi:hypothetical protein